MLISQIYSASNLIFRPQETVYKVQIIIAEPTDVLTASEDSSEINLWLHQLKTMCMRLSATF